MNRNIENLIPHKTPMILIDRLMKCDETTVVAAITITKNSPFFENGAVPAYVSIVYH